MRPLILRFSLLTCLNVFSAHVYAAPSSFFSHFAGVRGLDLPEDIGLVQMHTAQSATTAALPQHWDWRSVEGKSFLSTPKDQGVCGSCVAFAMLDTLETQLNISRNHASASESPFSRQFLFSCGGGTCRGGMDISQTIGFLQTRGIPEEACLPYTSGANGADIQCNDSCATTSSRLISITRSEQLTDGISDIAVIKSALLKGPVLTSIILYEDFMAYRGGVYRQKTGMKLGSHAVTLIGWDDSDKAWIGRNSFGADWGEGGYFRMAWDDARALPGRYTWQFAVTAGASGYTTVMSPMPRAVVRGDMVLQIKTTFANPTQVDWFIASSLADIAAGQSLAHGTAEQAPFLESDSAENHSLVTADVLDTTALTDGKYFLVAKVIYPGGIAETIPQEFFVLNGTLQGAVDFVHLSEGSQLSGLKKITISAPSSPVPFQEISLSVTNARTGETFRKTTRNVAPQTTLQWATAVLPNGSYLLSLSADAGGQTVTSKTVQVEINNVP